MNRKGRISLIVVAVLLLLGSMLSLNLVHRRVWVVQEALEQLVSSKTNGQYKLVVNDYSINLSPFKITFDSLQIFRNDGSNADVKYVSVRHLVLATGSLINFLRDGQLKIDTLEIEEPTIELTPGGIPKSKGIHFSQQVVKLYPAVLTILEHFNVHHLVVTRASLDIHQEKKLGLTLNLIDLLIENWNVKELKDDRQLRLAMGHQYIGLSKGEFNFAALEYDFQKRELRFSDFQYASHDSITNAQFKTTGEYIAFKHLDYNELFHNQRLVYERIIFQQPTLSAQFHLPPEKKSAHNTQKLLTEFVARTVGEFSLDSATIENASIHITMLNGNDSIMLDLPDVSVNTNKVRIAPDQEFQIGDIEIDMKQAKLKLKNDLFLSFGRFFWGNNNDLSFEDLELSHYRNGKKIAYVPFVALRQIDLFKIIGEKKLESASLEIRDAQVWIDGRNFNKEKQSGKQPKYPDINLGVVVFHNFSLSYKGATESINVHGLSTVLDKVKMDSTNGLVLSLKKFAVEKVSAELPSKQVSFNCTGVWLEGPTVSIKRADFVKNSLGFFAKDFLATHANSLQDPRTIDHAQWKSIDLAQLEISSTPEFNSRKSSSPSSPPNLTVGTEKLQISNIILDIHHGDTTLTGSVSDLLIKEVVHSKDIAFGFTSITGSSNRLSLKTNLIDAEVRSLNMDWPQLIQTDEMLYNSGDKQIYLGNFQVRDIQKEADQWLTSSVSVGEFKFGNEGIHVSLDSLYVKDFAWYDKRPNTSFIEVFHPIVQLKVRDQQKDNEKKPKPALALDKILPDQFVIHPGVLELPEKKVVSFGTIKGSIADKRISIQSIEHTVPKSIINVSNVVLESNSVSIDSITLKPNEQWYAQNKIADGKLHLALSQLQLLNQSFDSILYHGKIHPAALEVSNFDLFVTKDKRLPDPPMVEKPWSLSSMIKFSLPIQSVEIKDGDIRIEEISDKTGQTGVVSINDIRAKINLQQIDTLMDVAVDASARLYNQGNVQLKYRTIHTDTFRLEVRLNDFDLTLLNKMVLPSLSIEIKSGTVNRYLAEIMATNDRAVGAAGISYKNLHIAVNKRGEAERNKILSIISDEIFLRNSKNWVISEFDLERIKHKAVFNYWVRMSAKGAIDATLNGR